MDVSGNQGFSWLFFAPDIFFMALFFLVAGFFGRMLYQRRGWGGFARNRLLRIGVPLLVGWFILSPLIMMVWVWGGDISGWLLPEVPVLLIPLGMVLKGMMFKSASAGGLSHLHHLWFLYDLLWFCGLTLLA